MTGTTHLEPVMGTVVGVTSPAPIPAAALGAAVAALHEADRVFSTWDPASPMSRLRTGETDLNAVAPDDAADITEVLARCALARELTDGAFDPWAMPGGVDPTGLVKGWAAARALGRLRDHGVVDAMVNAGGDIAVTGTPGAGPWRVGIRHPFQPDALTTVVEVGGGEGVSAVATSGGYERPGQLLDPATGRAVHGVASATVTGPDLDLADALATGLAVAGRSLLPALDRLPGYEAYLVTAAGRHLSTPGMPFAAAA